MTPEPATEQTRLRADLVLRGRRRQGHRAGRRRRRPGRGRLRLPAGRGLVGRRRRRLPGRRAAARRRAGRAARASSSASVDYRRFRDESRLGGLPLVGPRAGAARAGRAVRGAVPGGLPHRRARRARGAHVRRPADPGVRGPALGAARRQGLPAGGDGLGPVAAPAGAAAVGPADVRRGPRRLPGGQGGAGQRGDPVLLPAGPPAHAGAARRAGSTAGCCPTSRSACSTAATASTRGGRRSASASPRRPAARRRPAPVRGPLAARARRARGAAAGAGHGVRRRSPARSAGRCSCRPTGVSPVDFDLPPRDAGRAVAQRARRRRAASWPAGTSTAT